MLLTVTLNHSLDEWAWLPRLRVGALNRAAGAARYPGGKGINVSRVSAAVLARLSLRLATLAASAQAPKVRVQSGVGAGDATVAGFLLGWLRTKRLPDALRWGIACGSAAVMTPGTELCRRADVERLRSRVTLRMLDVTGTGAL